MAYSLVLECSILFLVREYSPPKAISCVLYKHGAKHPTLLFILFFDTPILEYALSLFLYVFWKSLHSKTTPTLAIMTHRKKKGQTLKFAVRWVVWIIMSCSDTDIFLVFRFTYVFPSVTWVNDNVIFTTMFQWKHCWDPYREL